MKTNKKSLKKPSRISGENTLSKPNMSWSSRVKEGFTTITAVVSFFAAVLGVLVLYANNKGAFFDLKNDFYSWLYQKDAWTGLFNNFPEGYVDMASMNLSDTDLQLIIIVDKGHVDGVIANKKLCKTGFPNGYKLLKGDIGFFGGAAHVQAYDFERGYLREYGKFEVRSNGIILEVKAARGSELLLPHPVRIAQHPAMGTDEAMKELNNFCADERSVLMDFILKRRSDKDHESAESAGALTKPVTPESVK